MTGNPIYLVTTNLAPYDAIGNDVIGMRESLIQAGYRAEIYAGDVHPSFASIARTLEPNGDPFWHDPKALLIYHHSMGWREGQDLLEAFRGRVVVKYHNITPPRFFEPYSEPFAHACRSGEAANHRVAKHRSAIFWGDSQFNCEDLVRYGARRSRCRALAPFHATASMERVPLNRQILRSYRGRPGANILFVGGVKPNKGHLQLLRIVAAYKQRYDPDVRLFLAGGIDSRLRAYQDHLQNVIRTYGLETNVIFTGGVDASALKTYFFLSDLFLCMSEHEGFCVPLIEAMYFRSPIVAAASTAVPETVGEAGILWPEDDLDCIVESIGACMEDANIRRDLSTAGRRRYEDVFRREVLEADLLRLVEERLSN